MPNQHAPRFRTLLLAGALAAMIAPASAQVVDVIFAGSFEPRTADDRLEASRFLWRSTFGPLDSEIDRVMQIGYAAWIDEQQTLPATLHQPLLAGFSGEIGQNERQRVWWDVAKIAPDQLRQRTAFALSEILVVSDLNGDLEGQPLALAAYYDLLVTQAFGNYRELLEAVTLTPVMGHYLSMFRSTRDPVLGIEPDENYAREIMQLFSIGLVQLNLDGSVVMNGGQAVPTYDQSDIVALAEAFTGWNFAGADGGDGDCEPWEWRWPEANWLEPMAPCPVTNPNNGQPADYHVTTAKTIVGGVNLPAGQSAQQDLEQALDALFNHPNVGPFLARRLIQRLVTSNPSPQYIGRIAGVFRDNGQGIRGDLGATVKAILMDPEALSGAAGNPEFGKLREPLLRQTQINRVYDARINPQFAADPDCCWPGAIYRPEFFFGQAALRSPSVFNFFKPDFAQPGAIENQGLVSPEFEITTETQVVTLANFYFESLMWGPPYPWQTEHELQVGPLLAIAGDAATLVDQVIDDLLYGGLDPLTRQIIVDRINQIRVQDSDVRVAETIYYITTSPQAMVQQ